MNKNLLLLAFLCLATLLSAQVSKETFESYKLGEDRTLRTFIPSTYSESEDNVPQALIIVLDADYLFETVVANVKYYSYFEKMPSAIVVGIDQNRQGERYDDCDYSDADGFPQGKGNDFFDFISSELVPYLEGKYDLANFKMIVGHGITANFINYYMFFDKPLFNGYLALSPGLAPNMEQRIYDNLFGVQNKTFYYLATAQNDIKSNRERIETLDAALKTGENEFANYYFDNFPLADHNTLPSYGIPKAFDHIFKLYEPITPKEFKEEMLAYEEGPVFDYLVERYNTIESLFGFRKPYMLNDIMATYAAIKKKEDLESLELLAKLTKKEFPETMMGFFLQAEYYELLGEPKKALKAYEKSFTYNEIDFFSKDLAIERMDALKADFGY